jgi:5-methylcytosine-specific restriction protein A
MSKRTVGASTWKRRRRQAIERDGGCVKQSCRRPSHSLTVHHIIPTSEGGSDDLSNLETLCSVCHKKKHGLGKTKLGERCINDIL